MKKYSLKLIFAGFLLLISVSVVVMTTYAWLSLSGTPEIAGIIVNIGGSNTIKVAADKVETVDGETVHYPGLFSEKINFSNEPGYEYLSSIVGLTPYSTADGINWFGVSYNDSEESANAADFGEMTELQSLTADSVLNNANWSEIPTDSTEKGCYVYLDFWVVAPFDNCKLRVSVGDEGNGSCVVELKQPEQTGDKYSLSSAVDSVSLCARVGFLVNNDVTGNNSIHSYADSSAYSELYRKLVGIYPEKGEQYERSYSFMIYEPNGDVHADTASYVYGASGRVTEIYPDGCYVVTKPLSYNGATVELADISGILSVQRTYSWTMANENETLISQIFDAYITGKDTSAGSDGLYNAFYHNYLQGNFTAYLSNGQFFRNTSNLYSAETDGVVTAERLDRLSMRNASDDAVITVLYKNEPQRIRMFVWIEGQDVDCVNSASGKALAINLELAGSND